MSGVRGGTIRRQCAHDGAPRQWVARGEATGNASDTVKSYEKSQGAIASDGTTLTARRTEKSVKMDCCGPFRAMYRL